MRMRTRSPVRATIASTPGNTRLFMVHMLKSVITLGSGVEVPACTAKLCSTKA
jgi:hypothetical protein